MLIIEFLTTKYKRKLGCYLFQFKATNEPDDSLKQFLTELLNEMQEINSNKEYAPVELHIDYCLVNGQINRIDPLATYSTDANGNIQLLYILKLVGREPQFYLPEIEGVIIL